MLNAASGTSRRRPDLLIEAELLGASRALADVDSERILRGA